MNWMMGSRHPESQEITDSHILTGALLLGLSGIHLLLLIPGRSRPTLVF